MFIAIHCGGMPFNGNTIPKGESLGGSESACYYMAKELAKIGHKVVVFTASQERGRWDDVLYEWAGEGSKQYPLGDRWHHVTQAPYDVIIAQRNPVAFSGDYNSKLNVLWLHDLSLHRNAGMYQNQLWNVDTILTVSEFHKQQCGQVYGIEPEFIFPTFNGVDYAQFEGLHEHQREPNSLVFAARPERGLMELVGKDGIMEKLPDQHLYVCTYKGLPPQLENLYRYLWARCEELPNVTNVGNLGKKDLYTLLAKSMLYVYPTTFEDTSCIMVLEANAAGTPFIGYDHAAIPETAKDSGSLLLSLKDGQVDKRNFAYKVKEVLRNTQQWEKLHDKALDKHQSWQQAAEQWTTLFEDMLSKKCSNKHRLHKHLEHMSDVWSIKDEAKEQLEDNYAFMYSGDYEGHYERYYEYEKNRGVNYGPEDLSGQPRFEHTAKIVEELKPKTILDYGCAHGHYVINLLIRSFNNKKDYMCVGVDINKSNIEKARNWFYDFMETHMPNMDKKQLKEIANQNFICGDENNIDELRPCFTDMFIMEPETKEASKTHLKFDMVLCAEVLEHVPDPGGLCEKLHKHVSDNGWMVITVPYGAWEAIGYDLHPGWRAHIHHIERQDLFEIFGAQPEYKVIALPHGNGLGHYIVMYQPDGKPLGKIDYNRKLNQQAPQETVSVCMIAKDAVYTLGKTLESLKLIADEIIIGIDETTTDTTKELAESFGAITFPIPSPLKVGFDKCRNMTIEKAKMDWIFWIDSDETLENSEFLLKYLRPNCFAGYGIAQHHYAVEPAALFKTDYPVRLFRNHIGIKFFGMVHEHPETELNKGVGKVTVLPLTGIMHTGYSTENIRRKRFERNWPLMQADRKKYPDRKLGHFLWIRDCVHMIRYNFERNGGRVTPEMKDYAIEAIDYWRMILKDGNIKNVTEALPFYSEAVQVLGNGIEYEVGLSAKNGHPRQTEPYRGLFATTKDIREFTGFLAAERTKIFDEKYY